MMRVWLVFVIMTMVLACKAEPPDTPPAAEPEADPSQAKNGETNSAGQAGGSSGQAAVSKETAKAPSAATAQGSGSQTQAIPVPAPPPDPLSGGTPSALSVLKELNGAKLKMARVTLVNIKRSIDLYRVMHGRGLPKSLDDLTEVMKRIPKDPWDKPYVYELDEGGARATLFSAGPDQVPGTDDDISATIERVILRLWARSLERKREGDPCAGFEVFGKCKPLNQFDQTVSCGGFSK